MTDDGTDPPIRCSRAKNSLPKPTSGHRHAMILKTANGISPNFVARRRDTGSEPKEQENMQVGLPSLVSLEDHCILAIANE